MSDPTTEQRQQHPNGSEPPIASTLRDTQPQPSMAFTRSLEERLVAEMHNPDKPITIKEPTMTRATHPREQIPQPMTARRWLTLAAVVMIALVGVWVSLDTPPTAPTVALIAGSTAEPEATTEVSDSVQVVVTTRDIGEGATITTEDIALQDVPVRNVPRAAIFDLNQAVGLLAIADIPPNVILIDAHLTDDPDAVGAGSDAVAEGVGSGDLLAVTFDHSMIYYIPRLVLTGNQVDVYLVDVSSRPVSLVASGVLIENTLDHENGTGTVSVVVQSVNFNNELYASDSQYIVIPRPAEVQWGETVVVPVKPIWIGETITESDITTIMVAPQDVPDGAIRNPVDVIGKQSGLPLYRGLPITYNRVQDFIEPLMLGGERVTPIVVAARDIGANTTLQSDDIVTIYMPLIDYVTLDVSDVNSEYRPVVDEATVLNRITSQPIARWNPINAMMLDDSPLRGINRQSDNDIDLEQTVTLTGDGIAPVPLERYTAGQQVTIKASLYRITPFNPTPEQQRAFTITDNAVVLNRVSNELTLSVSPQPAALITYLQQHQATVFISRGQDVTEPEPPPSPFTRVVTIPFNALSNTGLVGAIQPGDAIDLIHSGNLSITGVSAESVTDDGIAVRLSVPEAAVVDDWIAAGVVAVVLRPRDEVQTPRDDLCATATTRPGAQLRLLDITNHAEGVLALDPDTPVAVIGGAASLQSVATISSLVPTFAPNLVGYMVFVETEGQQAVGYIAVDELSALKSADCPVNLRGGAVFTHASDGLTTVEFALAWVDVAAIDPRPGDRITLVSSSIGTRDDDTTFAATFPLIDRATVVSVEERDHDNPNDGTTWVTVAVPPADAENIQAQLDLFRTVNNPESLLLAPATPATAPILEDTSTDAVEVALGWVDLSLIDEPQPGMLVSLLVAQVGTRDDDIFTVLSPLVSDVQIVSVFERPSDNPNDGTAWITVNVPRDQAAMIEGQLAQFREPASTNGLVLVAGVGQRSRLVAAPSPNVATLRQVEIPVSTDDMPASLQIGDRVFATYTVNLSDGSTVGVTTASVVGTDSQDDVTIITIAVTPQTAVVLSYADDVTVRTTLEGLDVATHTIAAGDTLFSIAQQYSVMVDDLAAVNNIIGNEMNTVTVGDVLVIPQDRTEEAILPSTHTTLTIPMDWVGPRLNGLEPGDWISLSISHGFDSKAELRMSDSQTMLLDRTIIVAIDRGDTDDPTLDPVSITIAVPVAYLATIEEQIALTRESDRDTLVVFPPREGEAAYISHIVQPGDTLFGIAQSYNVSPDAIVEANSSVDVAVFTAMVGDELLIPVDEATVTHTIATGDTLLSIALQYGVDVDAILEANDLEDVTLADVGDTLRIPLR